MGLEWDQVRGGPMFVKGFVGSVDGTLQTSVTKCLIAVAVFESTAVFVDHNC